VVWTRLLHVIHGAFCKPTDFIAGNDYEILWSACSIKCVKFSLATTYKGFCFLGIGFWLRHASTFAVLQGVTATKRLKAREINCH